MLGLCVRFTCKDEARQASPATRRYLAERDQYLASTEVDRLTLQTGKGTSS
jgi:hypothetical protein